MWKDCRGLPCASGDAVVSLFWWLAGLFQQGAEHMGHRLAYLILRCENKHGIPGRLTA